MEKITPRLSFVACSFSQLSMIIKRPARQKPVMIRNPIHVQGSTKIGWTSATDEPIDTIATNERIWPARWTIKGAAIHPIIKPK